MQFFEIHLNPPKESELASDQAKSIFNSFCFEPENIYEKKLGSLFVIGELKNVLPQNLKFLDNFATFLKKQYYLSPMKFSPENSLKESLKKTNEFLEQIAKSDNVSWLGNLNLVILNLVPKQKKCWEINFTKVGEIKILLLRKGQIIDIGKNLEFSEIEPYPLKIFSNIVSGKLIEEDVILVLTKEVLSTNLVEKIVQLEPFEEKKFREILKEKEKEFLKISGICFLCHLKEIPLKSQKLIQPIIFKPKLEKFSISRVFSPFLRITNFLRIYELRKILKLPKLFFPLRNLFKFIFIKCPPNTRSRFQWTFFREGLSKRVFLKNLILISALIFFLLTGFFLFRQEKIEELKSAQKILEEVKSKKIEAESFLILKDEKQANLLFQEAWKTILPQTKEKAPLRKEALLLKEKIEEQLFLLNKLEKIEEPDLFFEFQEKKVLIPQKILASKQNFYFFNPFSSKIYKLNLTDKSGNFLEAKRNIKLAAVFDDSILFFSNPNILLSLKEDEFKEIILQSPLPEFSFDKFSAFRSNIYFLDTKSGEIAEYSQPLIREGPLAKLWLSPKTKKATGARSMAIDGSIWILTENKEIDRYAKGFYRETLKISFFPYLENPTKIWVSEKLPYLYILEPKQKRIIILTKTGEIIKQFQSEKFDNLLDFAISEDGKTIYLLNGLKVFKILL